jgi:hypothetical protein
VCLFSTSGSVIPLVTDFAFVMTKEGAVKALALLTAAALTLFSVAGAYAQTYGTPYGKGKAPPPPPVVTKGQASFGGPAIVPVPFFLEL